MRHLLLALMIALLPLRAWVGDAMAVSMLGHPAAMAVADAAHTQVDLDCPDHADEMHTSLASAPAMDHTAHDRGTHPGEATHPDPSHHQHSACDVCNGPALVMVSFGTVTAAQTHTQLIPPTERFASIALQQGIKPPIS